MINYGQMKSTARPQPITMTETMVFVASNIQPYEQVLEGVTFNGFTYDYVGYTKDEYLTIQSQAIADLEEELRATKILLGVE